MRTRQIFRELISPVRARIDRERPTRVYAPSARFESGTRDAVSPAITRRPR